MQFPLISRELISILKLVHGLFNLTVMLMFFYHARNGLLIRRARKADTPLPLLAVKRHRKEGPLFALLGAGGFCAGLALVFVDTGNLFQYPLHLSVGTAILLMLIISYRVSRKIAGPAVQLRDLHFRIGLVILALYCLNVLIGIGVLL